MNRIRHWRPHKTKTHQEGVFMSYINRRMFKEISRGIEYVRSPKRKPTVNNEEGA